MPREISTALGDKLATQYGTQPHNIIEVQWVKNGQRHVYGDKNIPASSVLGRILDLSGLDFVINVDSGSDSAELSVVLSDIDGALKEIIDTQDVHKRDVWVYQWFEGTDLADKCLIFQGVINSPVTWNEGDRTLKFVVVSKIEDAEIGFSIEEGQIPVPDPELIGVPWPLKFGTTYNVPALKLTSPCTGVLVTGVGISDFTLPFRINAAEDISCPLVFRGYTSEYAGNPSGGSLVLTPKYTPDEGCMLSRCETIFSLKLQLREQRKYEFEKITISNGENFPQGSLVTIEIDGARFTGTFNGRIFTIGARVHPEFDELGGTPTAAKVRALQRKRVTDAIESDCPQVRDGEGNIHDLNAAIQVAIDPIRQQVEAAAASLDFYNTVPTSSFFWARPGSKVSLVLDEPLVYVTNILPEEIHTVAAYRQFEAGRKLVAVPPQYYSVRVSDFGSYMVTEVVFDKALSLIDATWEDDLYITSTSSVGPNTVDIMEWLIEKYTDFDIDATSFAYVKNRLENYPSDFPLLERRNVLEVLREIAFQCRCAIYSRGNKFFLRYLSERPAAVSTIDESDVNANSFEIFHTDTEDIVTKLTAEWKRDYSKSEPNKIILRHNVQKYGTQEETINWYIYNELDYIHKSATFWLIRKSNTWRMLKCQTPINKLVLETFDGVDLTLADFSGSTIRGLISSAKTESNSLDIDFEIWTPCRAGTTTEYDFAWPADIPAEYIFPTEEDRDLGNIGSGDAPGFSVVAPAGHPISGDLGLPKGFSLDACSSQTPSILRGSQTLENNGDTCGNGNGDKSPSDSGDTKKEKDNGGGTAPDSDIVPADVNISDPTYSGFGGTAKNKEQEQDKRIADTERRAAGGQSEASEANKKAGGKGSGNNDDEEPKLPDPDDLPDNQCKHHLEVGIWKVLAVLPPGEESTPTSEEGASGSMVSSIPIRTERIYFKTWCETTQAGNALQQALASEYETVTVGQVVPFNPIRIRDTFCTEDMCSRQLPGGGGFAPLPTAYDKSVYEPSAEQEEGTGDWQDWYDLAVPFMDPSECAKADCPEA
jgi:hypothetical protein